MRLCTGLFTLLPGLTLAAPAPWQPLFNERDLSGWKTWLSTPQPTSSVADQPKDASGKYLGPIGPGSDPLRVFTIVQVDGRAAVRISGEVFGTLTTVATFSDYHLRLQFKWGELRWPPRRQAARDGGLLYHGDETPGVVGTWPRALEFQIQEGDCGDLFPLGMRVWVRARARDGQNLPPVYDLTQSPRLFDLKERQPKDPRPNYVLYGRCNKEADYERPRGEWNTLDLIALGADSMHVVNGHVVMRLENARRPREGDWVPLTSGHLSLQSEGAEIYFRDLELRRISAVPAEFSAPSTPAP